MSVDLESAKALYQKAKGSVERFVKRVFPPELVQYIPGQKLIAGAVVYVAAALLGFDATHVFHVPTIGPFNAFDVTVEQAAAFIAVYLWPTNKPVAGPKAKTKKK